MQARARLVRGRRGQENALRGLLASMGLRFPKGVAKFARRVRALVADRPELACVVEPMLSARAALEESIAALDREVAERAKHRPDCPCFPACRSCRMCLVALPTWKQT